MLSSGENAVTTNSDAAVDLIVNPGAAVVRGFTIINGTVAGFFSIDNGQSWCRLPASATIVVQALGTPTTGGIKVKRVAAGTDLNGVFGFTW